MNEPQTALERGQAAEARTAAIQTRHRKWHSDPSAIARLLVHLAKSDPMMGDGNDRRPFHKKTAHNEYDRAIAVLVRPWAWNEDFEAMSRADEQAAEQMALQFARGDTEVSP